MHQVGFFFTQVCINVDRHEKRVRKCPQGVQTVAFSSSLLPATLYMYYIRIYLMKGDTSDLLYLHKIRYTVSYTTCLGKGNICSDGQLFPRPLFVLQREHSMSQLEGTVTDVRR